MRKIELTLTDQTFARLEEFLDGDDNLKYSFSLTSDTGEQFVVVRVSMPYEVKQP